MPGPSPVQSSPVHITTALGINAAGWVELAAWVAAFAKGFVGKALNDGQVGVSAGHGAAQVVFVPVALFDSGQGCEAGSRCGCGPRRWCW